MCVRARRAAINEVLSSLSAHSPVLSSYTRIQFVTSARHAALKRAFGERIAALRDIRLIFSRTPAADGTGDVGESSQRPLEGPHSSADELKHFTRNVHASMIRYTALPRTAYVNIIQYILYVRVLERVCVC